MYNDCVAQGGNLIWEAAHISYVFISFLCFFLSHLQNSSYKRKARINVHTTQNAVSILLACCLDYFSLTDEIKYSTPTIKQRKI